MTQWIETDSLSNQDISSAVEIGSYTADADRSVLCQFFADQVVGDGDYVFYLTLQIGGAGSFYVMVPKTLGAVAAGETAISGQSIAVNVRSGDIIKVYLDGLAGDTVTPDTTVRWFELAPAVWTSSPRTLTQSAASIVAAVSGSSITIQRGDTLNISLTGLGDLSGYVSLDFTVKVYKSDTDDEAILRIRKNLSDSGDGLLRINGEAASEATNASIAIDDINAGDITVTLAAEESKTLLSRIDLYYDIQKITATAVNTMSNGYCTISADVTKAVV